MKKLIKDMRRFDRGLNGFLIKKVFLLLGVLALLQQHIKKTHNGAEEVRIFSRDEKKQNDMRNSSQDHNLSFISAMSETSQVSKMRFMGLTTFSCSCSQTSTVLSNFTQLKR